MVNEFGEKSKLIGQNVAFAGLRMKDKMPKSQKI